MYHYQYQPILKEQFLQGNISLSKAPHQRSNSVVYVLMDIFHQKIGK